MEFMRNIFLWFLPLTSRGVFFHMHLRVCYILSCCVALGVFAGYTIYYIKLAVLHRSIRCPKHFFSRLLCCVTPNPFFKNIKCAYENTKLGDCSNSSMEQYSFSYRLLYLLYPDSNTHSFSDESSFIYNYQVNVPIEYISGKASLNLRRIEF